MTYTVIIKPTARKAIEKLDRPFQRRIVAKLEELAAAPRGHDTVKLTGEENLYRVRVGFIRIIYSIHDDQLVIFVLRVAKRDQVYKR
jgi:mRNA interferase RelE/StbE